MSEPKRVVPQCLEFPDSLGHATKKEKKREKGKQLAPSFRFTIALPESNDEAYSEYNYAELVKSEEKKRRKEEQRAEDENATNGLDPFDDDGDNDENKLREMAKHFEAKYGTATTGRKRHLYDDYVDLGAGYDENDSFIDNTDAYDEIVPGEVTTAYGGFYINSGPLEFKPADGNSPVHSRLNNNNNNNNDEESSDDSAEEDEDEGSRVLKRMEKRIISSSEEDDDENVPGDPPRKKYKPDENGEKKSNHDSLMKKKRKLQPEPSNNQQPCDEIDITHSRKNSCEDKPEILDLECSSEDQEERKKMKYDLGKAKVATVDKKYEVKKLEKKFDIKRFEKKPQPQPQQPPSNGLDKKIDPKKMVGKDSNIDDAIESVVNAGRAEDESSRDTMDSSKSRCLAGTESECDEIEKEETPLPEPLPDDIKEIINKLKAHAEKNIDGKSNIFDEHFNATLQVLEQKLRMMHSPTTRLLTYGHLAHCLSCNKMTLVARAKKLCILDAEKRVKDPLQRLKVIIDGVMPSVVERYAKECHRVAEEKGLDGSPVEGDSSDGDTSEKSKIPRKKFPWSTETKKLVYDIACARRHYFKMRKPRKENMETFVASFMESKVLTLWPGGWMRLQTLLKYSNPEPVEKRKQKKLRDTSVPNSVSATAVSNSVTRPELSNINVTNTTSQERAKTPTSVTNITPENPINFSITGQSVKTTEIGSDRKTSSSGKNREKNCTSPTLGQQEYPSSCNRETMAKITVVPTSQLLAQKTHKSITEKFNPMDLTSSSLSITPVNDYQKTSKSPNETKKDVVSITPYSESSPGNVTTNEAAAVVISPSGNLPSSRSDVITCTIANPSTTTKQTSGKHRTHQESSGESKSEKRIDERIEMSESSQKTEKREKRRDRWPEEKLRTHESKKRRNKEHGKSSETNIQPIVSSKPEVSQPSTLSKEEQEQRQIEETMAATNFLSQIINDDLPRGTSEKRKESTLLVDEKFVNVVQQSSEQDSDVQMVMRSLKELQELREMKYSPSHSPVAGGQKPSKSSHQYVGYQDDYPRLYNKKDEKLRMPKEETHW